MKFTDEPAAAQVHLLPLIPLVKAEQRCNSLTDMNPHALASQAQVREAKAIVALAFRNGPLEGLHAGKICSTCGGQEEFS